jgi:hypothetical protein
MTDMPTRTNVPAPPYEDDDEEPAFQPRPRRRAHALTYVLAGAALVAAGFLGGVLVQQHQDHGSTNTAASARAASRFAAGGATTGSGGTGSTGAGGARAGGNGFGGGFGGNGVAGTVKLVDGNNIYVTDTSGNIVKVKTTKSSQVSRTVGATTKDLAPGDAVIVRGTQNPDGSYAATTVVDSTPDASN